MIKKIDEVKYGDFLEENIYRQDGLLAIPKGTTIKEKEKEYLEALEIFEIETESFSQNREYKNLETFLIIKDTFENVYFWDNKTTKKITEELLKRFKKRPKILEMFTLLRQIDHYSFVSSINISVIIGHIMDEGKVNKNLIDFIFLALIHDIGKIKVSKITTQKRELSESEFREVRNHPLYSFEVLQSLGFETKDIIFVQQTHEKWDGMGYPYSIGGKEIQTFAQIIGIVELYNALLSPRPHREAFHLLNVMDKIRAEKNKSFGEEYVLFFEDEFRPYKKGMIVELNNGMFGKILEIKNKTPLFPIVMLYNQNTGEELQEVNLYREKELKITQVLNEYK